MQMLSEESAALTAVQSNGAATQSYVRPLAAIDVRWDDVEPVYQPTGSSCWAAAASMVVGWRDRISIDPEQFARREGRWSEYDETGLYTNDNDEFARAWKLKIEPPQNYTVEGFAALLRDNGPLWVGRLVGGSSGHAVAVYGISGDGTVDGTQVYWHDPSPPGTGTPNCSASYRVVHDRVRGLHLDRSERPRQQPDPARERAPAGQHVAGHRPAARRRGRRVGRRRARLPADRRFLLGGGGRDGRRLQRPDLDQPRRVRASWRDAGRSTTRPASTRTTTTSSRRRGA